MKETLLIGCSGYYYPQWKKTFYPDKLPAAKWLEHYSAVFNTVELNGTFYRVPKLADLKRYSAITPDNFRFSVKMNKYITHTLRLKESKLPIDEFKALIREGLSDKLHVFLFQFPPTFQYSETNLHLLIEQIGSGAENVIEFRHTSWWNAYAEDALRKAGLTFCNVDYPGLQYPFKQTNAEFYLRLHGTPDLFKSPYSEEQLLKYAQEMPSLAKTYAIYFNNTYFDAAWKNALELKQIMEER